MKNCSILLMCLLFGLFSCSKTESRHVLQGKAQGTTFTLVYFALNEVDIRSDVELILRKVDEGLSTYDTSSYISNWNKGTHLDTLNTYFKDMFLMSKHVNKITDGYFDPTVEPLSQYFGFEKKRGVLPTEIDSILEFIGINKLKLDSNAVLKLHKKVKLNFNAIAQGYTVDLISDFLHAKNINNFIFELGGEVYCSGIKPQNSNWVIAIDKPTMERDGSFQNSVSLSDLAITTSGNYRKWKSNSETGQKYTHTINPKTGSSSPSDLLSVTVIHKSCAMADAFSTALLSMKYSNAINFLKLNKLEVMLIVEKDGEPIAEFFNGFENRLVDL